MWIASLAKEYIFFGKSITSMCEHNAEVFHFNNYFCLVTRLIAIINYH